MKEELLDLGKETLIGAGMAVLMMAALLGPQIIRLNQKVGEERVVVSAIAGPELIRGDISCGVGQASGVIPIEVERVNVEPVQASGQVSGAEMEISVPEYIVQITEKMGQAYSISPEFLQAIAWRESRFQPDAVNAAGSCFGLMQVSEKWHSHRLAPGEDILDPETNTRMAAEYLQELFEQYQDPEIVLMVYNGDNRALEAGYISSYARDILEMAQKLEQK